MRYVPGCVLLVFAFLPTNSVLITTLALGLGFILSAAAMKLEDD